MVFPDEVQRIGSEAESGTSGNHKKIRIPESTFESGLFRTVKVTGDVGGMLPSRLPEIFARQNAPYSLS